MSKKKFIAKEDFALPSQAIDLVKESIREGIEFDAYGDRQIFTALALTTAVPLTKVEATGYGAAFSGLNLGVGMRHKFKARIIDEDSPHLFLPDPCALAKTGNKNKTMSAIQRHTDFIQISAGDKGNKVAAGDIVEVIMRKNVFSYDLQVGVCNKILAFNADAADLLRESGCDTLAASFDYKRIPQKIKHVDTSDIGGGKIAVTRNSTQKTTVGPNGHGYMVALVAAMLLMEDDPNISMPAGGYVRKITVNDNERDGWAFAKIIYDKVNKYGWPHVYDMYKSKNAKYILKKLKESEARVGLTAPKPNLGPWATIFDEQVKKTPPVFMSLHQLSMAIDLGTTMYTDEQVQFIAKAALSLGAGGAATYGTRKFLGEPIGGYWDYPTTTSIRRHGGAVTASDEHLHIEFNLPKTAT